MPLKYRLQNGHSCGSFCCCWKSCCGCWVDRRSRDLRELLRVWDLVCGGWGGDPWGWEKASEGVLKLFLGDLFLDFVGVTSSWFWEESAMSKMRSCDWCWWLCKWLDGVTGEKTVNLVKFERREVAIIDCKKGERSSVGGEK